MNGGNSLSDLLVFGNRAGIHVGQSAQKMKNFPKIPEENIESAIDHLSFPFKNKSSGEHPFRLRDELQTIMEEYVGIKRDEEGLEKGITELQQLRSRASNLFATGSQSYNAGWQTCFDLINLIDVSLAIAYSALERKESRGAHTRIDFPTPSDPLGKVKFIVSLSSGKFNISSVSIPTPRKELLAMIKKDQTKQKSSGKK